MGMLLPTLFVKPRLVVHKYDSKMVLFTMIQLLQHNVQLGTPSKFSLLSSKWFIHGTRQNFLIINLSQTVITYRQLLAAIRATAVSRRHFLLVNERSHSTSIVSKLAISIGEAYAIGRWVGGTITNYKLIRAMFCLKLRQKPDSTLTRFKLDLKNSLRGMDILSSPPTLIFFNSVKYSYSATQEAYAMGIAAGGVTDTDALPDALLYPVPGNDDSFASLYFLNRLLSKTVMIGKMRAMVLMYAQFLKKQEKTYKWREKRDNRLERKRNRIFKRLDKLERIPRFRWKFWQKNKYDYLKRKLKNMSKRKEASKKIMEALYIFNNSAKIAEEARFIVYKAIKKMRKRKRKLKKFNLKWLYTRQFKRHIIAALVGFISFRKSRRKDLKLKSSRSPFLVTSKEGVRFSDNIHRY